MVIFLEDYMDKAQAQVVQLFKIGETYKEANKKAFKKADTWNKARLIVEYQKN